MIVHIFLYQWEFSTEKRKKKDEYFAGHIRLGLYGQNELLAVMVLAREPDKDSTILNITWFAESTLIIEGFAKLLSYVEREYSPDKIVALSNNDNSDDSLYEIDGFQKVSEIEPQALYLQKRERVTASEVIGEINNLPRIWDAGKIIWEKIFN